MDLLKVLAEKTGPYALFIVAAFVLGDLYVRAPSTNWFETAIKYALGLCTLPCGFLFVTKCVFEWPAMKGLDAER
jgi:hypothetical protein